MHNTFQSMRTYFHLFGVLLGLVLLSSCSDSSSDITPPAPMPSSVPVSFSALAHWDSPQTRLSENATSNSVSFTSGDAIGVFADHNNSTTPNFMNNQKVTFDGSNWTYEPVKYWPSDEEDKVDFYGYYPYGNKNIKIQATTSRSSLIYVSKQADTDVLAAVSQGQSFTNNGRTVQLSFVHLLAKVNYTFTSASAKNHPVIHAMKYEIPSEGTCHFTLPLSFDVVSDTKYELERFVSKSEGVVIDEPKKQIEEFTAYVLPCSISEFSVSINNIFVKYKPALAVTLKAGCQYTINFVISGDEDSSFFITSYSLWETDGQTHEGELK